MMCLWVFSACVSPDGAVHAKDHLAATLHALQGPWLWESDRHGLVAASCTSCSHHAVSSLQPWAKESVYSNKSCTAKNLTCKYCALHCSSIFTASSGEMDLFGTLSLRILRCHSIGTRREGCYPGHRHSPSRTE